MELESTDKIAIVYETIKNIEIAINRLEERNVQVHSVNDFLLSPWGMEKLDAACMVIIALGESVKMLDKQTDKKLLPTYPSIDWKKVMGARDIIAHHYFDVDAEEVFSIIKNDLKPLKKAIQFFKEQLSDEQSKLLYDLQGRKINKPHSGQVYIKDNKKMLKK